MDFDKREQALSLIREARWRETTYISPHAYILATDITYNALRALLESLLQTAGYSQRFRSVVYRYIDLDGYQYWLMNGVINRAKLRA